jgi:hypothetical protein
MAFKSDAFYYPNADEVRDDIPESQISDEDLETYWREAEGPLAAGYYI